MSTTQRYTEVDSDPSNWAELPVYQSYIRSPHQSRKHTSYFDVYTELLDRYREREFTFVEIGVSNGGSLYMWRDFFGERARIIGIDLNPAAKRFERDGFEIHVGNQCDPQFWHEFFGEIGRVDVILDDGGHTYEQQIVTAIHTIPFIVDGGMLIVEDTHTSYFSEFGYPSKYTFIEWSKQQIDNVNARCPEVLIREMPFRKSIHSIQFYESIVCFNVNRRKSLASRKIANRESVIPEDFRYRDGSRLSVIHAQQKIIAARLRFLKRIPLFMELKRKLFEIRRRLAIRKLKKYFR